MPRKQDKDEEEGHASSTRTFEDKRTSVLFGAYDEVNVQNFIMILSIVVHLLQYVKL